MSISTTTDRLQAFEAELARAGIKGAWQYPGTGEAAFGPTPAGAPAIWRWQEVRKMLVQACDVFPDVLTSRRGFVFINRELEEGTSHTLHMSTQMLKPGEIAWAHRHNFAAIRFAIEGGSGFATVVDGDVCPMENYDLILTPRMTWHDHHNDTDHHVAWFDALDLGLIGRLNLNFHEPFGDEGQPQRRSAAEYHSARAGIVRPVWERRREIRGPMRYPWREVEPRLMEMAELDGSPYDGVVLEYVNPVTGGPTMPTLSCWVQLLRPGRETQAHRHTSSSVYFVVRGHGRTIVEETELSWSPHDIFVIPNWAWHHFVNDSTEEAILFSVNDIPALQALDLYAEEPEVSLHRAPWPEVPANVGRQSTGPAAATHGR